MLVSGSLYRRGVPRRNYLAGLIALACASAGATAPSGLPPLDAWAELPTEKFAAVPVPSSLPSGIDAQFDARLGLPTFVRASSRFPMSTQAHKAAGPEAKARAHLKDLGGLYRIGPDEVDALSLQGLHALSKGAHIVQLQSRPRGIEVFRERISVLLDADGRLRALGGYVSGSGVPVAKSALAAADFGSAETALLRVLQDFGLDAGQTRTRLVAESGQGGYRHFSLGEASNAADARLTQPARAKPVWFRLPSGLVAAWYVEVEVADNLQTMGMPYAYVIGAKSQEVLFRHRQMADATFDMRVFAENTGAQFPLPDPTGRGAVPHPTAVADGFVPSFVLPSLVTAGENTRGDDWLAADATETVGNNVDAYVDIVGPDGLNAGAGDFRASVTAPGVFDRVYDTAVAPGASADQRMASVTHLFYSTNWLHDWFYEAGFDEASGNAQDDNYGRGGLGGDSMRAEGQDFSGTNNANMSTPSDGGRPRMQMYVWSGGSASKVDAGAPLSAEFASNTAAFGAQTFTLTADAVVAVDGTLPEADACEPLVNNVVGKVVIADRGACAFAVKALNIQSAGGVGMVLANNAPGVPPPGMGGTDPTVTIASLSVTQESGTLFKSTIGNGPLDLGLTRVNGVQTDSGVDTGIVAHEWGHYISNRLVQNSNGLTTNQAGGMGEGWADFHTLLMNVQEQDLNVPSNANFAGTYAVGSYVNGGPSFSVAPNNAFYFGIRRYPYSTDFTKNPLTFRHIDDSQALPINPPPNGGGANSAVHATGNVWSTMLWGCYAELLNDNGRLSFAEAQDRMKRYLVAGYKLTPAAPTFVEARDALLSAILVEDQQDFLLCAQAFASRGIGTGAVAPDRFSSNNSGVVESFTAGPLLELDEGIVLADDVLACDADGVLDAGETGTLYVPMRNLGFGVSAVASLSVSTAFPGISFPGGATLPTSSLGPLAEQVIEIPVRAARIDGIGFADFDFTLDDNGSLSTGSIRARLNTVDIPLSSFVQRFDTDGFEWTTESTPSLSEADLWQKRALSDTDWVAHGPDLGFPALNSLTSPPISVAGSGDFIITLRHRFQFEADTVLWDGGVIEVSTDGGTSWDDISVYADPGYTGIITDTSQNPLANRSAFSGASASYPDFQDLQLNLGSALAGQQVLLRFAIGTDLAVGDLGWEIESVTVAGAASEPFAALAANVEGCFGVQQTSGNPQITGINQPFADELGLSINDVSGEAAVGQTVTFSAPLSGASAIFSNGLSSIDVVLDSDGLASVAAPTANGEAGVYVITAQIGSSQSTFNMANTPDVEELFTSGFED